MIRYDPAGNVFYGNLRFLCRQLPTTHMLPKRTLGQTDLKVTQLGYGSMGLRGPRTWGVRVVDDAAAEQFLNRVLDVGINLIDTSPDYGVSEERIGQFIASRRNEYVLATKCGCVYTQHEDHLEIDHQWDPEVVKRNLDTSLKRLRTDHIDLLQFHGGDADSLQRSGLIDLLQGFKAEGVIRFIGVSTKIPNVEGLIALDVFDTFQMPFSCLAPEHGEWIDRAAAQGAGIVIRGGVAQGGPEAEIQRPALNSVWKAARLDEVLPEGISRAELILRYTLTHPHCDSTIVGTCNADHLEENVAAAKEGPLPQELYDDITRRVARSTTQ